MANNVHHTSKEGQAPTDIESQSSNSDENQIVFVLPEVKSPNRWNGEMANNNLHHTSIEVHLNVGEFQNVAAPLNQLKNPTENIDTI